MLDTWVLLEINWVPKFNFKTIKSVGRFVSWLSSIYSSDYLDNCIQYWIRKRNVSFLCLQVNCIGGPLTLNGIDYAWWNDVDGNVRNFWSGSSSDFHTCQCGIDGLCIDKNSQNPQLKCNCDANIAVNLSDIGAVTLKQVLPITQLHFGKTSFTGGSHLLGKLECSGRLDRPAIIPTSCYDLWIQGHTLNGLYNVKKDNKISSIYCDFTAGKPTNSLQEFSIISWKI